ncbi:MFS transporter, partial [Klebsiella michiganensis]|nr:MFS transporter [Klebsiella michiganensis]
ADRSVEAALITMTAALAVLLVLFAFGMFSLPVGMILLPLWGAASFALVPPLQMRVMDAAHEAPNLASAMNIGAFNLGNAIGAALGGEVIRQG